MAGQKSARRGSAVLVRATTNCALASGCIMVLMLGDTVTLRTANPVGETQPITGSFETAQGMTSISEIQGSVSG